MKRSKPSGHSDSCRRLLPTHIAGLGFICGLGAQGYPLDGPTLQCIKRLVKGVTSIPSLPRRGKLGGCGGALLFIGMFVLVADAEL
jgi:hypothetical protein